MNSMLTSSKFKTAYQKLNSEQKRAVDTIEGPVLVLAGPGTGKTQVLAVRVGRILQETQVRPANILCLTYTETGRSEMQNRLISLLGDDGYYVRVHTFHSLCNEIIIENPDYFLSFGALSALTDIERIQIFQKIIEMMPAGAILKPFGDKYFYLAETVFAISTLKREGIMPLDYQKALEQIDEFIEKNNNFFENFFALSPKERTSVVCLELKNNIQNSGLGFMWDYCLKIFPDNQVISEIPTGKTILLTSLKDKLKKFFESTRERLPKQKELLIIYSNYQQILQEKKLFDYEDMLLFVISKFNENKNLLATYQEQFQYILTDEFQDTNGAQKQILDLLSGFFGAPNLFVVGDDDQSIFRFQGASLENLLSFWNRFERNLKVITLQENYRSSQLILDASRSLIEKNTARFGNFFDGAEKKLIAIHRKDKELISVSKFNSEDEEDYWIGQEIKQLLQKGVNPAEIAVIFRNNADGKGIANILSKMQIPFKVFLGVNILNDSLVKQLIRLLKIITQPQNSQELFFLLHAEFLNFDPVDIIKLSHDSRSSLWEKINNEENLNFLGVKEVSKFHAFYKNIALWQQSSVESTLEQFFERVINESGLINFVTKKINKLILLNKINTLFDWIKIENEKDHNLTLPSLLEKLEILEINNIPIEEKPLEFEKKAISLLTAHKSKGMEFEHVFICRLTDRHWGNVVDRSKLKLPLGLIKEQVHVDPNEDERRLFYVALTRAKNRIYLSYALKGNTETEKLPSVFLSEIEDSFLKRTETSSLDSPLERIQTVLLRQEENKDLFDKEFIQFLLKDYKLSVTHLNNYLKCPRLWYYQNFLRVPAAKDKHAGFGSAVHNTLRDLHINFSRADHLDSLEDVILNFNRHLKKELMTLADEEESRVLGEKYLTRYVEENKNNFIKNTLVEYDFSHHNVMIEFVPITGKLDKIEIIDSKLKTVNVVDYKTGNPANKMQDLKPSGSYHRQIVFYQLLCDNSKRFQFKMASGEFVFIQPNEKLGGLFKHKITVTTADVKNLIGEITRAYTEIKSLKFIDLLKTHNCQECDFCLHTQSNKF